MEPRKWSVTISDPTGDEQHSFAVEGGSAAEIYERLQTVVVIPVERLAPAPWKVIVRLRDATGREALLHEGEVENLTHASARLVKLASALHPPATGPTLGEIIDSFGEFNRSLDVLEGAHDAARGQLRRAIRVIGRATAEAREGVERQEVLLARGLAILGEEPGDVS